MAKGGKKKSRIVSKTTYHKTRCACVVKKGGRCGKRSKK